MQGTWVYSLVLVDPTRYGAIKPVHHNYWACALEPMLSNKRNLLTATRESLHAAKNKII